MRTRNPSNPGAAIIRGYKSPRNAGSRGITIRDATTEAHPVRDITYVGATVTDNDDGTAVVTIGDSEGAPTTPADDTFAWMPLTTVVAGEPVLVWDDDDDLIPTLVPI